MKPILGVLLAIVITPFASLAASAGIADISNADAVSGLRQALSDGSAAAVKLLGAENGYFGNAKVKIPLPPSLQKVESGLRMFGMKNQGQVEKVSFQFGISGTIAPDQIQKILCCTQLLLGMTN